MTVAAAKVALFSDLISTLSARSLAIIAHQEARLRQTFY